MPKIPLLRHPVSFAGAVLTTFSAALFIVFFAADLLGMHANPYMGIVYFLLLPALFLVGLVLIPIGVWRQRRRRAAGKSDMVWPTINLNTSAHRRVAVTVVALTFINVVIVSLAAYSGVHYMDSTEFCGTVCHEAMEPQHVAFQTSPHAQVGCVRCHIGPGAPGFLRAKLSGTRQLTSVTFDTFARPVASPIPYLPSTDGTCLQCHNVEAVRGDKVVTLREYGDDEENSLSETTLQLHIGGRVDRAERPTGIHWHANAGITVEYVSTDATREEIPWVRVTDFDGTVREYVTEGTASDVLERGERRQMDCVDCHNRAGHLFAATPGRAVDAAITSGAIPSDLASIHEQSTEVLAGTYDSKSAGLEAIAATLSGFYDAQHPALMSTRRRDIDRAITATQNIYRRTVFPSMNVGFGTYANNLGHTDFPGCFRCHDDEHKTSDGRVISQSCDLCHTFR